MTEADAYWNPEPKNLKLGHLMLAGRYTYCPFCAVPITYARFAPDDEETPDRVAAFGNGLYRGGGYLIEGEIVSYKPAAGGVYSFHDCAERQLVKAKMARGEWVILDLLQGLDINRNAPATKEVVIPEIEYLLRTKLRDIGAWELGLDDVADDEVRLKAAPK